MNTTKTTQNTPQQPGSPCTCGALLPGSASASGERNMPNPLDLHTRASNVRVALIALVCAAEGTDAEARLVRRFLLSLWQPATHHLDIHELSGLAQDLNAAARHLLNFMVTTGAGIRWLLTETDMAPILAAAEE